MFDCLWAMEVNKDQIYRVTGCQCHVDPEGPSIKNTVSAEVFFNLWFTLERVSFKVLQSVATSPATIHEMIKKTTMATSSKGSPTRKGICRSKVG